MKWILGIVALVAVAAAGLLAYGYSYASSHGALSMFVDDISDPQRSHPIVPVELSFLDASGAVLATAAGTDPSGGIFLTSPQDTPATPSRSGRLSTPSRAKRGNAVSKRSRAGCRRGFAGPIGRRPHGAMLPAARAAVVR